MGISGDDLTDRTVRRLRENPGIVSIPVLADFCHVTASTAAGWLGNKKPMGGITTIHLWYLLDALGVEQAELTELRREYPFGAYVGELLAYGVVGLKDATQFGASTRDKGSAVQEGAIFRAVRGEGRIQNETLGREALVVLYDDELRAAKERLREKLDTWNATPTTSVMATTDDVPECEKTEEVPREQFDRMIELLEAMNRPPEDRKPRVVEIAETAELLFNALARANLIIYSYSPEERSKLREMMGDGIFNLANRINMLCSERAYEKGMKNDA